MAVTKQKPKMTVVTSAPALEPPSPPLPEMDDPFASFTLGPAYWNGFDFYHPELLKARQVISQWFADFWGMDEGGHIIISGGCGSGKTHLAHSVEDIYQNGKTVFITEPDIFASVFGNRDATINRLRNGFPLIIDDIGVKHINKNKWVGEIYWEILNNNTNPIMITTNLDFNGLCAWIGERASSRLLDRQRFTRLNYVSLANVPDYRLAHLRAA